MPGMRGTTVLDEKHERYWLHKSHKCITFTELRTRCQICSTEIPQRGLVSEFAASVVFRKGMVFEG